MNRDVQRALHPLMIGGGPGLGGARPQAPKGKKDKKRKRKPHKRQYKRKKEIENDKYDYKL